jgi:hypothetical protein
VDGVRQQGRGNTSGGYAESQNEYGTYYLTLGGFVVDIIFTDEGTIILIKTADDKFFKFPFDECLAFQKLTYDEQLILSLYDVLNAITIRIIYIAPLGGYGIILVVAGFAVG